MTKNMILRIIILICSCVTVYSQQSEPYIVTMNEVDNKIFEKDLLRFESNDYNNDEPITTDEKQYKPTWESLDNRPIPEWYEDAKVGIFIHWGVFSVPSFGSEWFWWNWKGVNSSRYIEFMQKNYPPGFSYQDFAPEFKAQFFNPTQWSKLFKDAGAKYVVLTSKHHEGFTLWPSRYTFSWTSIDTGPHKDLVGELAEALRNNTDLKFGLYHSMYEWFNPLYLNDKKNKYKTNEFVTNKIYPELLELVNTYNPEVIWSDGDWDATDTYWKSKEFLAWLYNDSPVKDTVVVNDRWGSNIPCHHGGFYTCTDRYNPGVLQPRKWENAMTIDKNSWGFRRDAVLSDYLTTVELVHELVTTVSCGGNILINVGPTKDGVIDPIFEDRLIGLGSWLSKNGEAIYGSRPWTVQNDTLSGDVWYTKSSDSKKIYATLLSWPNDNILKLGSIKLTEDTLILFLSTSEQLKWKQDNQTVNIRLPANGNRGEPAWTVSLQKNN